jgi:hypothetical protein
MAYQINKTDGTIISTVPDGQVDTLSTDLTLIGKNYSGFGESLNENFIKLLENFANSSRPPRPVRGQIWFDTSELKLKVYSGTEFLPVSSATISNVQPSTLATGDLWFNDIDKQLYFYDGTNTILLGPSYSVSQGLSGLKVVSILDTLNQTRVVTYLYNNGILLGIFAKDFFTPKATIPGFTGNIVPGFNAGNLAGIKFNVTCTNSEKLGGQSASIYLRSDTSNVISGQLTVSSDSTSGGLVVGSAGQGNLYVINGDVFLSNSASDKNLILNVRRGIIQENAVIINPLTRNIGLYSGFEDSSVAIGGSLTVDGDFVVNGTTTTINAENLVVEDKNIVLAKQTGVVPTDINADTGGIILQGSSSHIFMWSNLGQSATVDSSEAADNGYSDSLPDLYSKAWNSSEHINLASGKYFAINGEPVITGNSLGVGITSIPGVTSFGTQTVINVGPGAPPVAELKIENHKISTLYDNFDLEIEPHGTGNVSLLGSPKITGLADPTDQNDAANKKYVDEKVETRNIVFSMDLTDGKPNSYITTYILNNIAPPVYYRNGTLANILCTILNTASVNISPSVNQTSAIFNTPSGTASALTNVAIPTTSVPAQPISTTRVIKTFQIIAGAWSHISDTILPP